VIGGRGDRQGTMVHTQPPRPPNSSSTPTEVAGAGAQPNNNLPTDVTAVLVDYGTLTSDSDQFKVA
jgi:hypothetical protein